jgi:DNA cross-link repair 1A protein
VNECIDASSSSRPQTPSKAEQPLRPEPGPSKDIKAAGIFSVLLSSNKENLAWKEAAAAEDRSFRPSKANGGRRKAPFYKVRFFFTKPPAILIE